MPLNRTALSRFSLIKARDYVLNAIAQADSSVSISVGSAVRSLLVTPASFIYSGVMNDLDSARDQYISNYNGLSDQDMDNLAENYGIYRDDPTFAYVTVYIYLEFSDRVSGRELISAPYFTNSSTGMDYIPADPRAYTANDIVQDPETGDMYIPVLARARLAGFDGRAASGQIDIHKNLPFQDVISVTNPESSFGGVNSPTNEEFYERIVESFTDGTLTQEDGIVSYFSSQSDRFDGVTVIDTGHPLMMRDEVWVDSSGIPNLDRSGKPWAVHANIGTVNFNLFSGRGYVVNDSIDIESYVGSRIEIPGDPEYFRTIIDASNADRTIIVSGYPPTGQISDVLVWGEGMHVGNMADVYVYSPVLEVEVSEIDYRVACLFKNFSGNTMSLYVPTTSQFPDVDGEEYLSFKISPRTEAEVNIIGDGVATTSSITETYDGIQYIIYNVSFSDWLNISILDNQDNAPEEGSVVFVYKSNILNVSDNGDISLLPIIHVIDMVSINSDGDRIDIPETTPGPYDPPGWYFRNTDPANLYSARESKQIIIDEKRSGSGTFPHSATCFALSTTNESDINSVRKPSYSRSMIGSEGRLLRVTSKKISLGLPLLSYGGEKIDVATPTSVSLSLTINTADHIEYVVGKENFFYDQETSYSNEGQPFRINTLDSVGNPIESNIKVLGKGNKLIKPNGQTFFNPQLIADIGVTQRGFPPEGSGQDPGDFNPYVTPDVVYENAVCLRVSESGAEPSFQIDLELLTGYDGDGNQSPLITVWNDNPEPTHLDFSGYSLYSNIEVDFNDERGNWTSNPINVIYASSIPVRTSQDVFEDSGTRNVCTNTLIRSVMPSLIDTQFRYSSSKTPTEIQQNFIELIAEARFLASSEQSSISIDISNVISELNAEELTDFLEVNFEIRVKDFLPDGEYRVRYLNPSLRTRQMMSLVPVSFQNNAPVLTEPISIGSSRITVKKMFNDYTSGIPERGKVYLGGNNDALRETIPYEAYILLPNGDYTLILRGGYETQKIHYPFESVIVTERDFDPALEMNGFLTVPSTNRPYARQVIAIKIEDPQDVEISNPYDPFFNRNR